MGRRLQGVNQTGVLRYVVVSGTEKSPDLEALYRRDYAHLVGLAHWVLGHRGLAEEIVQETFVRVLENPPRLTDQSKIGAYMRSAVLNRCRSRIRRLLLERKHHGSHNPGYIEAEHPDQGIRDAVVELPMRQRQCVVLRFYDDLTVDQIAETLDISSGSVKTHLHRGLKTLANVLGGPEPKGERP